MRSTVRVIAIALVTLATGLGSAQNTAAPTRAERKVITRVVPIYPELARRMHIHGAVRVETQVRANGSVKSTRVLGGNPVLVDSAVDAISKWKFEPGQNDTIEVVQLTFEGQ
ncbi:MAG: energy transducer TonB [Candidatus Sulfotelmatobacter sp.]